MRTVNLKKRKLKLSDYNRTIFCVIDLETTEVVAAKNLKHSIEHYLSGEGYSLIRQIVAYFNSKMSAGDYVGYVLNLDEDNEISCYEFIENEKLNSFDTMDEVGELTIYNILSMLETLHPELSDSLMRHDWIYVEF